MREKVINFFQNHNSIMKAVKSIQSYSHTILSVAAIAVSSLAANAGVDMEMVFLHETAKPISLQITAADYFGVSDGEVLEGVYLESRISVMDNSQAAVSQVLNALDFDIAAASEKNGLLLSFYIFGECNITDLGISRNNYAR
jgi:type II secretory pathway component PulL